MTELPILCHIDAIPAADRGRHEALAQRWRGAARRVVELPDGYAFAFEPATAMLLELAEFVSRERLCCPFFHFEIVMEAAEGPLWLRLRGGEAVKAFTRENLLES